ncbi:recombinase family protein [Nocardia sp. CA-290969]|uniref:recombinase family protein n=1 Tax=Nocardia sp. CA-290969 TaxID=3239986 RepID=UPI003D911253
MYLRQSDDPNDDTLAISRQWKEIVRDICTPRGWEPVRYCDNDLTAVGPKRNLPDRDRMLADIEAGELQAIASWDLDRLYREPVDLERIIDVADRHSTLLATLTGDVDLGTDNGRLFARIKGAVAKAETERRSARQKSKYRELAEAGKNLNHRRSFGRNHDGSLHPLESAALADAYEKVLQGHSLNGICQEWNALGITTTLGNKWNSPTQLAHVLKNPRNAGWKSYYRVVLDEAEVGWDRIVSPDVWRAVNDILAEPSRRPVDVARKYQLSGIALCGDRCAEEGQEVTVKAAMTTSRREPIYRCRRCHRVVQRIELVDDHINDLIVGRLSKSDAADLLVDQKHPDLEEKRVEAAALRSRLKTLAMSFADGDIDKDQLRAGTERAKSKLKAIEQSIEDANRSRIFKGVVGKENAPKFRGLHLDRRRAITASLMSVTLLRRSLRDPFDPGLAMVVDWKSPAETQT